MARLNQVYMMGRIEDISIKVNEGKIIVAVIKLLTARRSYRNEKGNLAGLVRSDIQQIITKNAGFIERWIQPLNKGDLVMVEGTLTTKEIRRNATCPHCYGQALQSFGVKVYVHPGTIMPIRHMAESSAEEITQYLTDFTEFSNRMFCFGTLVREPKYAPEFGINRRELSIQLALNRRRFIMEDGPDKRTDYPHVKVFGPAAEEGWKVLHTGSEIYIDGAVETREVSLKRNCPLCGNDFTVPNVAIEIVPYAIEYIDNVDVSLLRRGSTQTTDEYGTPYESEGEEEIRTPEDAGIKSADDNDYGEVNDDEEEESGDYSEEEYGDYSEEDASSDDEEEESEAEYGKYDEETYDVPSYLHEEDTQIEATYKHRKKTSDDDDYGDDDYDEEDDDYDYDYEDYGDDEEGDDTFEGEDE